MPRGKEKNRKAGKRKAATEAPSKAEPTEPEFDLWKEFDNDATRALKDTMKFYEEAADVVEARMKVVEAECRIDHTKDPRVELARLGAMKDLIMFERARIDQQETEAIRHMQRGFGSAERNDPIGFGPLMEIAEPSQVFADARKTVEKLASKLLEDEGHLYQSLAQGLKSGRLKPLAAGTEEKGRAKELLLQLDQAHRAVASWDTRLTETHTKLQQESHVKKEFQQALKELKAEHRSTSEKLSDVKYQLDKERSSFQKEKKALEEAHRTDTEHANAQIKVLQQNVGELRSKLQHREVSENVASLKQQLQRNGANFEREKKAMQERHLREMEKANGQIGRLQQDLSEAQHYSHDLERYRTEMRDAREQIESLRVALREADDENREMKRSMDQLATDFERASVDSAIENRQLLEQLAGERAKVEELTEQIRTFTAAGAINAGPSHHVDEAFRIFQDQVYATVFGNHDGYTSIEELEADLREYHGINSGEIAQNYGYDSLPDFLRSREMASKIIVETGLNGVVYKGIPNETNAHLREAHQISSESQAAQNAKLRRNLKAEERNVANLRQEIKALHEKRRCQICMDRTSDTTFLCGQKNGPKDACGHVVCGDCGENWRRQGKSCHLCRGEPIFKCVKLFLAGTE